MKRLGLAGRDHVNRSVFTIFSMDQSLLVSKKLLCKKNQPFEAIIDTGSGITVFSPELCELLQIHVVEWSGPNALLAVGKRANVEGTVETDILIKNVKIHVMGLVFGINGYKLLLGNYSLR